MGELAIEVVVGEQAEDGDAQAAGGGDEGFSDSAAHFSGGELVVADEAEGSHDAGDGAQETQEWGEGDECAQNPLAAFGAFQFVAGGSCIAPSSELWALSRPS